MSFATGPYRTPARSTPPTTSVRVGASSERSRRGKLSVGPSEVLFLMFFVMPLPILAIALAIVGRWSSR